MGTVRGQGFAHTDAKRRAGTTATKKYLYGQSSKPPSLMYSSIVPTLSKDVRVPRKRRT